MFKSFKGVTFVLVLGFAAFFALPTEAAETFTFQGRNSLLLSVETYKTTNDGWTPIALSLNDLEFSLWMDADGRVFESPQYKPHGPHPLFIIDLTNNTLNLRDRTFPFLIRTQNEKRTRVRLMDKDLPLTVKIDNEMKRATLHLGKTLLDLGHIKAEFIEIRTGSYELKFAAPIVQTTEKFIFLESTGILYATHKRKGAADITDMPDIPDMSNSRIWLKKIDQGDAK